MYYIEDYIKNWLNKNEVRTNQLDCQLVEFFSKWITRNLKRSNAYYQGSTTYGIKHLAERDTGLYLTNETFILACKLAGISLKRDGLKSPNFLLGVTPTSVRRVSERLDQGITELGIASEISQTYRLNVGSISKAAWCDDKAFKQITSEMN